MSASRPFVDSFGFSWQVCEVSREDGPSRDAVAGRSEMRGRLYFFSRGLTRVLDEYPGDWHRGSWVELENLCARAAVLGADLGAIGPGAAAEARVSALSGTAR